MSADERVDARPVVDQMLAEAVAVRASDVHVEPVREGYEIRFRVDGLLRVERKLSTEAGRAVVTRLMVMAQLLTYRVDIPQEGRMTMAGEAAGVAGGVDMRVSMMPTALGLRAAVRLPADLLQPRTLDELNLPGGVLEGLRRFARGGAGVEPGGGGGSGGAGDGGMLLMTGPAGSGKTTTIYALLSYIAAEQPGLSIISLEDPVERAVEGVTQIEVAPHGQMTYERALKSILRQDPQVLMLGEIRDAATASVALQGALSGHRLICTLHAGSVGGAIARLYEMGCEGYQITSAVYGVVAQRLLRRRDPAGKGYRGRVPVAEFGAVDGAVRAAILRWADSEELGRLFAAQPGYRGMMEVAQDLVKRGVTTEEEVRRVLGGRPIAGN